MDRQIVCSLEVEPELGGGAERLSEEPGRPRRDTTLASNDLVDPLNRDTNMLCKSDLRLTQRQKELFAKNLSGVRRNPIRGLHA
jgi:hypothetical protein